MKSTASRWLLALGFTVLTAPAFGYIGDGKLGGRMPITQKGVIEVVATYGSPDYVKTPQESFVVAESTSPDPNLKSFAVGYKGWNLMGEWVYSASFYWELNYDYLQGSSGKTVYFRSISKYSDLAKLYRAIRPVSVNFVLHVTAESEADGRLGYYLVSFRVTDNDLVYFGSRSDRNYIVPASPAKWKYAISERGGDDQFTDRDGSSEANLRKIVAGASAVTQMSNGAGAYLHLNIRWPVDAIDAIGQLYLQREKEAREKKARGESVTAPPVAGPLDEAAKTFEREANAIAEKHRAARQRAYATREEELKQPVTAVNQKDQLSLKRSDKIIATFDRSAYSDLRPLGDTKYFVLTDRSPPNNESLVDRSGVALQIGKESKFSGIDVQKDGTFMAFVTTADRRRVGDIDEWFGDFDSKLYASRAEAETAVTTSYEKYRAAQRRKHAGDPAGSAYFVMPRSYYTVGLRRYLLDSDLSIRETAEGFQIRD